MQTAPFVSGLAAVVLCLLCFQLRQRKAIIACNVASRFLYVTQYLLLGALSGAAMDLSAIPASMLAARKNTPFVTKYRLPLWLLGNLVIVILGALSWQDRLSLLPVVGVFLETSALWLTKEKHIRLLSLLAVPPWMLYNVLCGAWGSVIGNVLMILSILTALLRYDMSKKEKDRAS